MLKASIVNPSNGKGAVIDDEGNLNVVVHPHPPRDEINFPLPFRQFLTDDGTSTGDNDMRINGSSTTETFCVNASSEFDIYIKNLAIVISDAGAALNEFGAITALTNGVDIYWESQSLGKVTIAEGLKSNFDFVQVALGQPSFGTGTSSFRANNISGSSEGFIPVLDLSQTFGLDWGVKLTKGTQDKLCFDINDNTSAIDRFDCLALGIIY